MIIFDDQVGFSLWLYVCAIFPRFLSSTSTNRNKKTKNTTKKTRTRSTNSKTTNNRRNTNTTTKKTTKNSRKNRTTSSSIKSTTTSSNKTIRTNYSIKKSRKRINNTTTIKKTTTSSSITIWGLVSSELEANKDQTQIESSQSQSQSKLMVAMKDGEFERRFVDSYVIMREQKRLQLRYLSWDDEPEESWRMMKMTVEMYEEMSAKALPRPTFTPISSDLLSKPDCYIQ